MIDSFCWGCTLYLIVNLCVLNIPFEPLIFMGESKWIQRLHLEHDDSVDRKSFKKFGTFRQIEIMQKTCKYVRRYLSARRYLVGYFIVQTYSYYIRDSCFHIIFFICAVWIVFDFGYVRNIAITHQCYDKDNVVWNNINEVSSPIACSGD